MNNDAEIDNCAIKYTLNRPIILIDFELKRTNKLLKLHGLDVLPIDGWIAFDDNVNWREIFLFKPKDILSTGETYKLNTKYSSRNYEREWSETEVKDIKRNTIKCQQIDIYYNDKSKITTFKLHDQNLISCPSSIYSSTIYHK